MNLKREIKRERELLGEGKKHFGREKERERNIKEERGERELEGERK